MSTLRDYLIWKKQCVDANREKALQLETPHRPIQAVARVAGSSGVRQITIRDHHIVMDAPPEFAGYNLGPGSPELLLGVLASCLAHSYLIVATAHNIGYDSLEVEVQGTFDNRKLLGLGANEADPIQNITYIVRVATDATDEQLAQVTRDVQRSCPVLNAIRNPVPVEGSIMRVEYASGK